MSGAPHHIDVALRDDPRARELPFVPSELMIREAAQKASEIRRDILWGCDY